MPLYATEGESKPKQLPPAGTHVARCFSVIDLGTQMLNYMGDEKLLHKIRVTWELPDELTVFKEENGEQPFVVSKDYTLSLFKKANLRQDLESWRGKAFTAEELKGFDIFTLLGAPCLLSVIHKTTENGKTFANVTTVSKPPKGTTVPKQINESVQFSIDDGRNEVFTNLPEWLKKKIEESQEWTKTDPTDPFASDPTEDHSVTEGNEPLPF